MRRRWLRFFATFAGGVLVASIAGPARAVDAFEIQVYDGTANRGGQLGLELHVNHVFAGPRRVEPPALLASHLTTFTLEPSFGVRDFWELGGYFQTALRADGEFDYAGVKLRSKFVTPPNWDAHVRLGVNFEFSVIPRSYDPDRYGAEIRPIAAWENELWLFALNPILDLSFTGGGARQGPAFEPCVLARRKLGPVAFGLEYYTGLGPLKAPVRWAEEDQYLYETFDWIAWPNVELDFGIGEGLSASSNGLIAKSNLGYVW